MRKYIDFELIKKYPNKFNLNPEKIKNLKILDWDRLKEKTWRNNAMTNGTWWCHLEGSNEPEKRFSGDDEFWIGFREEDNQVDCSWTAYEGMCAYIFDEFYTSKNIENKYDMYVQANTIAWLNMMIEQGILGC